MASLKTAGSDVTQVKGEVGQHSFSEEETVAFAEYINSQLDGDAELEGLVPMGNPHDLFKAVQSGVLICKLINVAVPNTVDMRAVNIKKSPNPWQRSENHTLAINSAKAIGVSTVNIGPPDLEEGRPHIVLGLVWQVIKIGLLKDINLKAHKELVRLLKEGETLEDLLKLPPEEILLRWVNYHMAEAGNPRRIKNFSADIKDSEVYTVLLKQICPNKECTLAPLNESNLERRADLMLGESDKIGCRKFVKPKDVTAGNPKLNLAFVANLFNNYPALAPINEADYDFAELLDFDEAGMREERQFRFWIQSLGIDCNNLFDDAKDGLMLLKVQDKIEPGCVDWKKVNMTPKMKIHQTINCNQVVDVSKKLGMSVVNVGGEDIQAGNKKLILGTVWQLMRYNLIKMLTELGGGVKVTDESLISWANGKVASPQISSFKDPSLGNGVFLCRLVHAVAPRSCNPDLITGGETEEDAKQNARYALSVARKIGCLIFALPEDIVEVNPKMLLTVVASVRLVEHKQPQQ